MDDIDRNDNLLAELLQKNNSIVEFLDTIFGFLARRTDFYIIQKNEYEAVGLPIGMDEQLVLDILKKWRNEIRSLDDGNGIDHPFIVDEEIEIELGDWIQDDSSMEPVVLNRETNDSPVRFIDITDTRCNILELLDNPGSVTDDVIANNEEYTDELKMKKLKSEAINFQPPDYFNGASYEHYCWSQTISDLDVNFRLPDHIHDTKKLSVKMLPKSITITAELSNGSEILFNGELYDKCRHAEVVWSVSGRKVQINLEKQRESWWERFLNDEPSIDVKRIDCTRPIEELPDETQAAIHKIQWDEDQKALGLPTSQERIHHQTLKKAWDLDGSPFKGTEFDPNQVQIN